MSAETATTNALADALTYADRGWRVAPTPPTLKHPGAAGWQDRATTDPDTITGWFTQPGAWSPVHSDPAAFGVCIVTGAESGVFVIDVDTYAGGSDTLADIEAEHGALPQTVEVVTGRGGRHLYFKVPAGVVITNASDMFGAGIDVRGEGGQVVAPPTVHPDTGQRYEWEASGDPDDIAPADAPAWLIRLLTERPTVAPRRGTSTGATTLPTSDTERPGDRYERDTEWADLLTGDGWTLHSVPNARAGAYELWTRPGKHPDAGASASLYYAGSDVLKVFTPNAPGLTADATYSRFGYYAATRHHGDHTAAAGALATSPSRPSTHTVLPLDFWDRRPLLQHIRQGAQARRVAPAAVLGVVFARTAAFTPPSTVVPPFVGAAVPLTTFVALMADTGGGKSTAMAAGADLLPGPPPGVVGPLPLGSGEGVADAFLESIEATDDNGRKTRRRQATKIGALFTLDEGRVLADIAGRRGSTIAATLCTAWVGADLGQANASVETHRHVKGGHYAIGLVSLWQPARAAGLFDDTEGGLPGRFLFLPTIDPDAPDVSPRWPGPLVWTPPALISIDGTVRPSPLTYPNDVRAEVDAARLAALRGANTTAALDAHRTLHRLKISGLLAVLDGRHDVNAEDWEIAGAVLDLSDTTRSNVLSHLRADANARERSTIDRTVRRELAVVDSAEARALNGAARAIARRVHSNPTEPQTRRQVSRAIAGQHRQLVSVDDAVNHAIAAGWITGTADAFTPGASRPT